MSINHDAHAYSENVETPLSPQIYSYSRPLPLSFFASPGSGIYSEDTRHTQVCVCGFVTYRNAPTEAVFHISFLAY